MKKGRRYYRGSHLDIEWDGDDWLESLHVVADKVTRAMADDALATAQALVPKKTGTLKSEIEIKISKFPGGGAAVVAQGPGNYDRFYATFVELGTHTTRNQSAQPYLRPALKRVRRKFKKAIQDAIDEQ